MKENIRLIWRQIHRYPFVSIAIVGINLLVFILCIIFPQIYDKGGCGVYQVLFDKDYARVLWATFLHSDAEHIFNNMIIVLFMGSILEQQVGHIKYGLIYFVSGIGANLFSLFVKWYQYDWAVSIGASGAVFGLDGLLLAMVLFRRDCMDLPIARVILVVFLSVYSGFTHSGIDNAAHVGGLVLGFVLGMVSCIYMNIKGKRVYRR